MSTEFWSLIADWALVIITLTYAGFTIGIFLSNRKANELTKKQLADSNKQHDERKRLEILPYFKLEYKESVDPLYGPTLFLSYNKMTTEWMGKHEFTFVIENIGLGTAKSVKYFYAFDTDDKSFDMYTGRGLSVPVTFTVGERKEIGINFLLPATAYFIDKGIQNLKLTVGIIYEDLLSNKYQQQLEINYSLETTIPLFLKSWNPSEQKRLVEPLEQNA